MTAVIGILAITVALIAMYWFVTNLLVRNAKACKEYDETINSQKELSKSYEESIASMIIRKKELEIETAELVVYKDEMLTDVIDELKKLTTFEEQVIEHEARLNELGLGLVTSTKEIELVNSNLSMLKDSHAKVVEANMKRAANQPTGNVIEMNKEELQSINILDRIIADYPSISAAIISARYTIYYKDKTTKFIYDVTGGRAINGIYKITNVIDGKCYVGKSNDIGRRFKEHLTASGSKTKAGKKLYNAMMSEGLHNFSFEVVEENNQSNLLDREQYWQEYYGAKTHGYSMR